MALRVFSQPFAHWLRGSTSRRLAPLARVQLCVGRGAPPARCARMKKGSFKYSIDTIELCITVTELTIPIATYTGARTRLVNDSFTRRVARYKYEARYARNAIYLVYKPRNDD